MTIAAFHIILLISLITALREIIKFEEMVDQINANYVALGVTLSLLIPTLHGGLHMLITIALLPPIVLISIIVVMTYLINRNLGMRILLLIMLASTLLISTGIIK